VIEPSGQCTCELERIVAITVGHLGLLTTKNGRSYNVDDFSSRFRTRCDAVSLLQRGVFHGLRKRRRSKCATHEIAAINGYVTLSKGTRYTKATD